MLLTRAPVASKSIATSLLPLDLHVLGLSLAFILSQDQTLRCISFLFLLYFQRFAPELKTLTYCSCLDVDFFYFPFSRQGVKPVKKNVSYYFVYCNYFNELLLLSSCFLFKGEPPKGKRGKDNIFCGILPNLLASFFTSD